MIKFFRAIRQRLIAENRLSKYLLYAIGEIVLVVIGILIALQVSNKNQSNQQNLVEQIYHKNLLNDLKDQLSSIERQMAQEREFYETTGYIIQDYEEDKALTLDSLFFKNAALIGSRRTFLITDPTYTDLISSGNIGILHDISFKDKLIKYYQELERIEKIIQNNNAFIVDQLYLDVYQRFGYDYYPDLPSVMGGNIEILPGIVNPKYDPTLAEISRKRLLKKENLLEYMNVVNARNSVAIGHFNFLKVTKKTTKELIQELEEIISK